MIGSIGDLVYLFPSLEVLRRRHVIDMGTGGYPYRAVVGNNPHVAQVYAPFIYKPSRGRAAAAHHARAGAVLRARAPARPARR
jgi:hypothetical protein